MAFLWNRKEKPKTESQNPSPVNYDNQSGFARNLNTFFLKKLSLFAPLLKEVQAGMTVEAAVALPVCLLFLMNLSYAVEIIRLHNNLQYGLWDAGSRIAVYGCEQGPKALSALAADVYVAGSLRSSLGMDYLDHSPLVRGSRGLGLWGTRLSDTGNEADLVLTCQVGPMSSLAGFRPFYMVNRCYVRLWTGYDVTAKAEEGEYVYVAENGTVSHKDRSCTHLTLSVCTAAGEELENLRNQWGQKYGACAKCGKGEMPDTVYVTEEGLCYHYSEDCSGIKRTVTSLTTEEAAGYPPCSRCGGEHEKNLQEE